GDLAVARGGMGLPFNEARALEILERDEVTITFDMRQGDAESVEWTCDLTENYVHINADYRS
ncbi:MAG TPA: bifunctional ornithine acetyltransferase/N-acetylglutamate synthase, partial [Blastocatellia bacterium]